MGTSKLLGDNLTKCWEVTCDRQISHPGGVEILLVTSYLVFFIALISCYEIMSSFFIKDRDGHLVLKFQRFEFLNMTDG